MESKKALVIYIILTAVFSIAVLITLAYTFLYSAEIYYAEDCRELEIVPERVYSNKSIDIRIEAQGYEAVFTVPPIPEMKNLIGELFGQEMIAVNGEMRTGLKLKVYIAEEDAALLQKKPRAPVKARQLVFESESGKLTSFMMSFDERNHISSENHLGIQILVNGFSFAALAVSAYHAVRVGRLRRREKAEILTGIE